MSALHLTDHRQGFPWWYTKVLDAHDDDGVGMEFGILRVPPDSAEERYERDNETHLVLLSGSGTVSIGAENPLSCRVSRGDLFREKPWAFHLPKFTRFAITTNGNDAHGIEFAVVKTAHDKPFDLAVQTPEQIPSELRGKGLAQGAMEREVRAIFGDPNAPYKPKASNIVIGEVVNFPGKWSSYPPHYHPQPEVYYYRFDKPQGFGFSQAGGDGHPAQVRTHDVVKITNCVGHAQVAAPGYAMWYLWFLRQLPRKRYKGNPPFTYFPEHVWANDPKNQPRIFTPEKSPI